MSEGTPVMWMRGGTSKGAYFLAEDLPQDRDKRDEFLLNIMGSPDPRQIDGIGGADPLTSKVAVIRKSERPGVDVDFLFLQVFVDQAVVTDAQNCGNILAGVAPFAIERGLAVPTGDETSVTIFMENTGQTADARVQTPEGVVSYQGSAQIDGVPGTSAPIAIAFRDTAGSSCGALFPTGRVVDEIDRVKATLIDNGMPCVLVRASELEISGLETPAELEQNTILRKRLEAIRLKAGVLMNLGDVTDKSVPKMTLISAAENGGTISTRTFIPHRCHKAIGVLGAVSVATAVATEGAVGNREAMVPDGNMKALEIEHPSGNMSVTLTFHGNAKQRSEVLLTARKLIDGTVFPVP